MPNRPLVAPQVQSISFDPAAAMQDVASIQINRQRMDEARRKSMASMRMRQLAQQYPDSPLEFVDAVTREFPEEGFALGESYWKGIKENAQAHKAQTESSVANLEVGTRILQAARQNPALYSAAKQWITKMSPEVGSQLSDQYNEQEVDGWLQTGQKTSDFLKAQADAADRLTKQDTRGSVLALFAGASNPQQWQTAVDLTTRSGLKPLLGLVASEWSPEAQAAAAKASISPEKQAELEKRGSSGTPESQAIAAAEREKGAPLTSAELTALHGRWGKSDDRPRVSVTVGGEKTGGLVDAVIANPSLWDDLTPTVKGQIAPALQAKGFEGFGKMLPPAAVKQIAESDSALDSLKDLRETLKANEAYIGPIAGLAALNPYSDARKAQASIDLVRQRVGKALEGGVLRKEDEEKYKKILANLTDTPATAIAKVDQLIHSIEQDKKNFVTQQRLSGRRVNPETTAAPGGVQEWVRDPKTGKLRRKGM